MKIVILHPDINNPDASRLAYGLNQLGHTAAIMPNKPSPAGVINSSCNVVYAMGTTNIPPGLKVPVVVNGDVSLWKDHGDFRKKVLWNMEKVQIKHGCFSAVVANPQDEAEFGLMYDIPVDSADPKSKDYIKTMERILKEAC